MLVFKFNKKRIYTFENKNHYTRRAYLLISFKKEEFKQVFKTNSPFHISTRLQNELYNPLNILFFFESISRRGPKHIHFKEET